MKHMRNALPGPGGGYSFLFAGETYAAVDEANLVAKLFWLWQSLDPSFLPALEQRIRRWMRWRKVTRPFLARNPQELFPTSPHLASYALPVMEGWWIDRNNDTRRKREIVGLACEVAGVKEEELRLSFGWGGNLPQPA